MVSDQRTDSDGVKLIRPANGQNPALGFTGEAHCVERLPLETKLLLHHWECLSGLVKINGHEDHD